MIDPQSYVSVLRLYKELPPLDLCLAAAHRLHSQAHDTPNAGAFKKALDFFEELSKSGMVEIRYDAAHALALDVNGESPLPEHVKSLLERVMNLPSASMLRDDEDHLLIHRRASLQDGYRRASAHNCDCDHRVANPDTPRLCAHIAIVRVVEAALMDDSVVETSNGVLIHG